MSLTLRALYEFDNNLFGNLVLPEMVSTKHCININDKSMICRNIMLQCGQFETLHIDPEEFKEELHIWSTFMCPMWEDLFKTTIQNYELIHNYDRYEELTEKRESTEQMESSGNSSESMEQHGEGDVENSGESSGTNKTSVSAWNSTDHQPKDKTENNATGRTSETRTDDVNSNRTGEHNTSYSKTGGDSYTKSIRAYGNIGVTTAQQMLTEERELVKFSIIQQIVNDFKMYFCVTIY